MARDTQLDRSVAVKIPRKGQLDASETEQFVREARAAAQLKHPNIVAVHEVGKEDGQVYIVSDYIEGLTLADWLLGQQVTSRTAAELCVKLAEALHHAHEAGVIHRDLKPTNIMIDSDNQPHVMDFGLAKREAGEVTMTMEGKVLGTPAYMSPEQAKGEAHQADCRSDVYSLGVILYEMLTGHKPFRGNVRMLLQQVIHEDAPSPRRLNSSIPRDLETLCLKCLEKDPRKRYSTAQDLSDELNRFLRGEPIAARPITAPDRAWRWCKRNPVMAALGSLLATVLVILAVAGPVVAINQTRLRGIATRLRQHAEAQELVIRQRAYAADMNLAQQALDGSNLGRALELLNRNRPEPGERNLRDWEWRYLWRQCQSDALFTLTQRSERINSLAISHDGNWLAIGEKQQGGVSVWDLRTRREITSLPGKRVAFSPRQLLLAFSNISSIDQKPSVSLWSGASRQIVAELPLEGLCVGLEFSSDGKTLATSTEATPKPGGKARITLWQVSDGRRLESYSAPQHIWNIGTPFDTSDDMSLAAHTPEKGRIRVIDLATGKERWNALAHSGRITALSFSPDGNVLASSALESPASIRLWDAASGTEIGRLDGHRAWIGQLVFWPDGKRLASASADQTIRLWDLRDATNVPPPRILFGHRAEIWRLALLPDSVTLVSGAKDGSVYFWDTATAKHEEAAITLPAAIDFWRFSPDSKSVLTVDRQGRVARWGGAAFQQREPLLEIGENRPRSHISQDGRLLAASSGDGSIRIWDLKERTLWRELDTGPAVPWTFLDQGNKLVTIDEHDGALHAWDLTTKQEVPFLRRTVKAALPSRVFSLSAFSPDEQWCLLKLRREEQSLLWEAATGLERLLHLDNRAVDVAFSPDGSLFAVASDSGFVSLWKAATQEKIATFRGFLLGVHSVAFSPSGKRLAAGSSGEEAIKLFDVESREELLTLEARVEGSFKSTAFSPDGNILGSLSFSGVLHLWRAAERAD